MKFFSILFLSAAGSALARGGGGDDNNNNNNNNTTKKHGGGHGGNRHWRNTTLTSPKSQCRQLARLTELTTLSADPTQAAAAAERLATLQSNTTLMASCSAILAADEMEDACRKMAHLEKLSALVANATALAAKDPARVEEIKVKVADAAEELRTMQGNETLTGFCAEVNTKETCRWMNKLQRWADKGDSAGNNNGTGKAGGGKFRGNVADVKAELEALKGNATLVEACASFEAEKDGLSSGSGSSSDNGLGGVTAGAGALQPLGTVVVSLATVFFFGLLVL